MPDALLGVSGRVDVRTGSCARTYERSENQPVRAAAVRRAGRRAGEASAAAARPVRRGPAVDARSARLRVLCLATARVSRRRLPLHSGTDPVTGVRRMSAAARRTAATATVCTDIIRLTDTCLTYRLAFLSPMAIITPGL